MKEKRRVFSDEIDYILNYPRTPVNNDYDFNYEKYSLLRAILFILWHNTEKYKYIIILFFFNIIRLYLSN